MNRGDAVKLIFKRMGAFACSALLAGALCACGAGAESQESAEPTESEAAEAAAAAEQEKADTRQRIEEAIARAAAATFENATVTQKTETTAAGRDDNGQETQQTVTNLIQGEFEDKGTDSRVHISYEVSSSMQPGKTAYDMYVDKDTFFVVQGEQLYTDSVEKEAAKAYIDSFTAISSEQEVKKLLDVASNYRIDESEEATVISITADASKLGETDLVDTSSLPEGASVATLVANYVIGPDDRPKTVRLMSSTTGLPTYRVIQTYNFSKYDETELPDWPDLAEYASKNADIHYDDEGNMYLIGEDGVQYFIDSFEPDGTVRVHTNEPSEEEQQALAEQQAQQQAQQQGQSSRRVSSSGGQTQQAASSAAAPAPSSSASTSSSAAAPSGLADPIISDEDADIDSSLDDPVIGGEQTASQEQASSGSATTSTETLEVPVDSGSTSDTAASSGSSSGTGSTASATEDSTAEGASSETTTEQTRAYITGADGTVHYLDEPGSEIRDFGGTRVFIDANGEWYFLSE